MFTINVSKKWKRKDTNRHTYKYTEVYWVKTDESLKRNRDTDKETYNDIDTKESMEMDLGTDGNTDRTKEMVPHSVSKKS